jgi:5-methylcytosine-specific restriction endonuclease McrA
MSVFVLDKRKKPLMPCSERRARLLLERGRAVVHRRYPFAIRLKDRVGGETQPVRVKLDPGSKITGIAVVANEGTNHPATVKTLVELAHRGRQISETLTARRGFRRRRRSANLRYRAARFDNRRKPEGWLPPSLQHRVDTCMSWVERLRRLAPLSGLAVERVRFDTQLLENPGISGAAYQQGTLLGYEVREYLLEKHGRHCAYCGAVDVPLNLDHVIPRSRGGSNRASNLLPACIPCNEEKGASSVEEFLAGRSQVLARIKAALKAPLKDAAAVNATRWAREGRLTFTQWKGRNRKPKRLQLPILPALQRIINESTCGDMTFLVNDLGRAFTDAGFGNKFRDWCDQAPRCTAHGLR